MTLSLVYILMAILAGRIAPPIFFIRGHQVILDSDLAALFGAPTHRLNEQIRRNRERFPEDFAFVLRADEAASLISQIAISKKGRGGRRKPPLVLTEHGVVMAANVLKSARAAAMSLPRMPAASSALALFHSHLDGRLGSRG